MRWVNTETPTFAGNAGANRGPAFTETMQLVDRDGTAIATFTKDISGTFATDLYGATEAEIDQFNDVSAYQESVTAAGALSVTKVYSGLAVTGGGAVTLAAPPASMLGQIKTIEMTTDDGNVTLALTNVVGQSSGTTATFGDVRDTLVLLAASDKWVVIKESGVALA